MEKTPPLSVQAAVARLWAGKYRNETDALGSRAFELLLKACIESYAQPGSPNEVRNEYDRQGHESALQNLFRNVGAPWYKDSVTPPSDTIARTIHQAYTAQTVEITHLCPLDQADTENLPEVKFGPCEIKRFSANSLDELVRERRLRNFGSNYIFDTKRFALFSWLVVRETVPPEPIGKRSDPTRGSRWPSFYEILNMKGDVDLISVHKAELPEIVEQAVFVLLLYPWEDVVEDADTDWRPFWIPWIYSVRCDPFAVPDRAPSPNSLTWDPEEALLGKWDIKKDHLKDLESLLSEQWDLTAKVCPITDAGATAFNPLVRHFIVQAFRAERFDEFLYHIVAIEAALARKRRKKDSRGATNMLKQRIKNLVRGAALDGVFGKYYCFRSDYLHGHKLQGDLRTGQLKELRSLTRNVIRKLVSFVAKNPKLDRNRLLDELDRGL